MKKLLSMAITMTMILRVIGCTKTGVSTDYPSLLMVDNEIYVFTQTIHDGEIEESEIIGYTSSYTNEYPQKNGETNFSRELKLPYAKVGNDIVISINEQWHICKSEDFIRNKEHETN